MYMFRYSNPVNGGSLDPGFCNDKKPICVFGGILQKILSIGGIYHFVDALLRLEVLWTPVTMIANITGSFVLGFIATALFNIMLFTGLWRGWILIFSCLQVFALKSLRWRQMNTKHVDV